MKRALFLFGILSAGGGLGFLGSNLMDGGVSSATATEITAPEQVSMKKPLSLGQFIVPVMTGRLTTSYVVAEVHADVDFSGLAYSDEVVIAKLRDSILVSLNQLSASGYFLDDRVDVAHVTRSLLREANRRIGNGAIEAIHLDRMARQKNRAI